MGDVKVCAPPRPDGLFVEEAPSGFVLQSSNPHPPAIDADNWRLAERSTERIIRRIQPTKLADEGRRKIVEHVRSLIKGVADAEVFPPTAIAILISDESQLKRRIFLLRFCS